jgi:DNA-binding beta-propeller fold protein YncE
MQQTARWTAQFLSKANRSLLSPIGAGHVFVNIEDKSLVEVIDSRQLKVLNQWPLAPGEGPSGLALDIRHHRLFSVCQNKTMVVMDSEKGRVIATIPIGSGTDAARFDAATGLAFSSNGEGTLTVVHEDSPDKFTVVESVTTQRGARTMELDPKTHNVYLVTADYNPTPQPTAENPRPRPTTVRNSFTLLIYGK